MGKRTGGAANREWNRGRKATPQQIAHDQLVEDVRRYIWDCHKHRAIVDPAHHPTAEGAAKAVFYRTKKERETIVAEFERQHAAYLSWSAERDGSRPGQPSARAARDTSAVVARDISPRAGR